MSIKNLGLITVIILLNGCAATISPEASNVQLHSQVSNIVDGCKKLGPVRARGQSVVSMNHLRTQTKANLRQAAYDQYQADTVVMVNMDASNGLISGEAYANGIAYNCFK